LDYEVALAVRSEGICEKNKCATEAKKDLFFHFLPREAISRNFASKKA
jgi:hypothetical protein